jgi:transcriptional regulator with XRE-family HTH domain
MVKHLNRIPILVSAKEIRDGRRYKQKEIAAGSGLSEPIISRLMRDDDISGITYATAKALAQWLDVSMEELAETTPDEDD